MFSYSWLKGWVWHLMNTSGFSLGTSTLPSALSRLKRRQVSWGERRQRQTLATNSELLWQGVPSVITKLWAERYNWISLRLVSLRRYTTWEFLVFCMVPIHPLSKAAWAFSRDSREIPSWVAESLKGSTIILQRVQKNRLMSSYWLRQEYPTKPRFWATCKLYHLSEMISFH